MYRLFLFYTNHNEMYQKSQVYRLSRPTTFKLRASLRDRCCPRRIVGTSVTGFIDTRTAAVVRAQLVFPWRIAVRCAIIDATTLWKKRLLCLQHQLDEIIAVP